MPPEDRRTLRIAAVADVHCSKAPPGGLGPLFTAAAEKADVLVLAGDLTDYGHPEEARNLAQELSGVRIPVVAVLGNHDCESNAEEEVKRILGEARVHVLDGDGIEIQGVGFAGVKGFGGGFGRRTLEPWGETATKAFVREAVDEALKLESALARLRTPQRVAVLHYSPIEATVEGEPREIFPFLGSSRLEEPINRYNVAVAFHGHAHRGSPEGRTSAGIPVYNVAMPLLKRLGTDLPVRYVDVEVPDEVEAAAATPSRRREDRA
ncbi:MAG TPA: metallophosphoesterase [Vicinamibacteria bacterium]|nr:metallophosphoesterase [Vicinamibacteria bacterium]